MENNRDQVDEKNKETKDTIKKNILSKNEKQDVKFKLFDPVRIKLKLEEKTAMNWSKEIYFVSKVFKPKADGVYAPSYEIRKDFDPRKKDSKMKGRYYNEDLQLVTQNMEKRIADIKMFLISKIIKAVEIKEGTKFIPSYQVRWKGYRETTTEPRENLLKDVPKKLSIFDKKNNVLPANQTSANLRSG